MSNGGPHDHPGHFAKVMNDDPNFIESLDALDAQGFEFRGLNEDFVLLYQDNRKKK